MDRKNLAKLLAAVRKGEISPDKASEKIGSTGYEDIVFAKVDHHRQHRLGFPEVIYAPGKTPRQVGTIAKKLLERSDALLVTRADKAKYREVKKACRLAVYHELSGAVTVERGARKKRRGNLLVISAGTSDIPVAEEAAVSADVMGLDVKTLYDVGVAGIHRLLDRRKSLEEADCIIVAAGMDGALASVVGGMVSKPVIALPTSVGYGAAMEGLAPLLAMLNSCAGGIAVVNIDNGFGAAALANRILSLKVKEGGRG
ncbi:MAG: nickel pincer cofactor biosynthesis protein LarB [Nitrospinae bacterium]|nr:nickel pincer cofactor biosynthesis protein LarB [Nitrospinota bacterium]